MKLKVVISGLIFPWTMLHLFWRAFERRDDVDLFVTGPFYDEWTPWNYGMKIPNRYVKRPNCPLPPVSSKIPLPASFVQRNIPWKPDLWLQIDAGWHTKDKPDAGVVGHIQTDPHVLKEQYRLPISYSDVNWCMQTPYMEDGEKYLPYGYDPEIHYPEDVEKEYDACLIGLHYEQRDRLVSRAKSRGLKVYYSLGEIYDEYRLKYNQSRIALSWSSLQDLPARNWEALAMGLPLVCNRVPDMNTFFTEGDHYLGFDTVDEAEKQIMTLMVDADKREEMAQAGYRKVTANNAHSWDTRVNQILKDAKLI